MSSRAKRAELIAQILDEAERRERASSAKTLAALWDEYYAVYRHRPGRAPALRSCRLYLDIPVPFEGGEFKLWDLPWPEVTQARLTAWLAHLTTLTKMRGSGTLSPGYVDQLRIALQGCFTFHAKTVGENPFEGIPKQQKESRVRQGYWSARSDDFSRHLEAVPPIYADMLRLSARAGGLRLEEFRTLKKTGVDRENRRVKVRRKGGKEYWVNLDDVSRAIIDKWAAVSPSEYVFANPRSPTGEPIPRGTLWKWGDKARDPERGGHGIVLGGEKPVNHHARHAYAMEQLRIGQPPNHIAAEMGITLAQFERVYGRKRGAADAEYRQRQNESPLGVGRADDGPAYPCPVCRKSFPGPREAVACLDSHESPPGQSGEGSHMSDTRRK